MTEIDAVGSLAEPMRRALYEYVVAQDREVSRAEAAEATGVRRNLASFHLDRLVEAGLLEVSWRKLSGREGPGSGRPAKLYHRATRQYSVHLPPRDYESAAHLLAEAVERSGAEEALYAAARAAGVRQGAALADGSDAPPTLAELAAFLSERGYEPVRRENHEDGGGKSGEMREENRKGKESAGEGTSAEDGEEGEDADTLALRNCPFHTLADEFPPLTCGMNLALLDGLLSGAGAGAAGYTARIAPAVGRCCVVISKTNND